MPRRGGAPSAWKSSYLDKPLEELNLFVLTRGIDDLDSALDAHRVLLGARVGTCSLRPFPVYFPHVPLLFSQPPTLTPNPYALIACTFPLLRSFASVFISHLDLHVWFSTWNILRILSYPPPSAPLSVRFTFSFPHFIVYSHSTSSRVPNIPKISLSSPLDPPSFPHAPNVILGALITLPIPTLPSLIVPRTKRQTHVHATSI
jgi:hypothetical protein